MTTTSGTARRTNRNRNPQYLAQLLREGFVFSGDFCDCFVSLDGAPSERRWKARVSRSAAEAEKKKKTFVWVKLPKEDVDAARDYAAHRGATLLYDERPLTEQFDSVIQRSRGAPFDEALDWYPYSLAGKLLMLSNGLAEGMRTWTVNGAEAFVFHQNESGGSQVKLARTGDEEESDDDSLDLSAEPSFPDGSEQPESHVSASEVSASEPQPTYEMLSASLRRAVGIALTLPPQSRSRNVIFEGVPGTGKTDLLRRLREELKKLKNKDLAAPLGEGRFAMTMHPATAYEDFVEGLRPASEGPRDEAAGDKGLSPSVTGYIAKPTVKGTEPNMPGAEAPRTARAEGRWFWDEPPPGPSFRVVDGFFVAACAEAARHPWHTFVVLLDELNRCNVPKVMGDLLTTLESSRRARWQHEEGTPLDSGYWDVSSAQVVSLPHSKRLFFVPDNLFVVGTMNTTDRSVAPLDAALRRRFAFVRMWPIGYPTTAASSGGELLSELAKRAKRARDTEIDEEVQSILVQSVGAWRAVNSKLETHGPDALLGHSYLFDLAWDLAFATDTEDRLHAVEHHWNRHILPQLADVLVTNDLIDEVFGNETEQIRDASMLGWGSAKTNETTIEVGTTTLVFRAHAAGRGLLRHPSIRLERRPQAAPAGLGDAPPAPAASPSAQAEAAKDDGLQG
jgi:MoxR-like ATPase